MINNIAKNSISPTEDSTDVGRDILSNEALEKLEIAKQYTQHGFKILAVHYVNKERDCSCGKADCGSVGKHPFTKYSPKGEKSAISDINAVKRWLNVDPNINIGGVAPPPVFLVDKDPQNGGHATMIGLIAEHGDLPETLTVQSGSGGEHLAFRAPDGTLISSGAGKLGPGIDIKGSTGYVVLPGSRNLAGKYTFVRDFSYGIAEAPAWMLEKLTSPKEHDRVLATRDKTLEDAINEGERNDALFRLACSFRSKGLPESSILAALIDLNLKKCNPPLEEEEVKKIASQAALYPPMQVLNADNPLQSWYLSETTYRSQEDVATLFKKTHEGQICFSSELNRWMVNYGKYWEVDVYQRVVNLLTEMLNNLVSVVERHRPLESDLISIKKRESFLKWAISLKNRHNIEGILKIAAAKCAVPLSKFDSDDLLYNFDNGTLDLRTGELRPHRSEDYLTGCSEWEYHPEAVYKRWDSFLEETLPSQELRDYVQKIFGYCLTGLTSEEVLPIIYGPPSSGKSTFYEPIMIAQGSYGKYASFATFTRNRSEGGAPREDLLRLKNARLVMCSEVNPDTTFDTALMKQICSGEPLTARGIRARESVQFPPKFKLVLGTNYPPKIPYDDAGSYRRIKVIPFDHQVAAEKIDRTLKETFKTNKEAQEAIAAWLVEGCRKWLEEGLGEEPREVERANQLYRRSQNPIAEFINDYCVMDAEAKTSTIRLVAVFNSRKAEYGIANDMSADSLGRYLKALGVKRGRINENERGWIGIRPKQTTEFLRDFRGEELEEGEGEGESPPGEGGAAEGGDAAPHGIPGSLVTYLGVSINLNEKLRVGEGIPISQTAKISDKRHPSNISEVGL